MAEKKLTKKEIVAYVDKLACCYIELDTIEVAVKALNHGLINKAAVLNLITSLPQVPVAERRTTLLKYVHVTLQKKMSDFELSVSEDNSIMASAMRAKGEGIITKDVVDDLASLNYQVPMSMRFRYLLLAVQATLQEKLETFESYVLKLNSSLITFKAIRSALDKHVKDGIFDMSVLEECAFPFPMKAEDQKETIDEQEVSKLLQQQLVLNQEKLANQIKTCGKLTFTCSFSGSSAVPAFGPQHISQLIEVLAGYAYKWKYIGIALKFQSQDLQSIEASPLLLPGAPKSYLIRMLEDWLLMAPRHALPPTVDNLRIALSSQIVGLGDLGQGLLEIAAKSPLPSPDYSLLCPYSSIKVKLTETGASAFPIHGEVFLKENQSTLLEVVVTHIGSEEPTFKWRGGMINNTQPILCIRKADIDWDGIDIVCEVKAGSNKFAPAMTVPITVHVSCPLDEFKPSLSSMYLARPEVPEDTWPPVGSTKYINLAIIKQQTIIYGSEYARLTIRGDIDDILQHKETIEYDKMYSSLKRKRQILFIEGRPGSGKTTFAHKITHDWASKSGGTIRLLLLVSLRVLNTIPNPNLSDILHLFGDLKVTPELIEKRDGKGVCFIFDGLDEFSPPNGKHSVVHKIINKAYLHQSTVVVASRPAAMAKLRNKADTVVEVLGFLNSQFLNILTIIRSQIEINLHS